MTNLTFEMQVPCATGVTVTDDQLTVQLADGRCMSVSLVWYPRLVHARADEWNN